MWGWQLTESPAVSQHISPKAGLSITRSRSLSQPRTGRDFGDLEAFLNEEARVPRSMGGGAGRPAGEPFTAWLSATPLPSETVGQHRVRCPLGDDSQADPEESQPGLFHLRKRGWESRQEHSNFRRRPATRRNSSPGKITVAEGSGKWQVDWQDYLSNFRPARRYYLENNK